MEIDLFDTIFKIKYLLNWNYVYKENFMKISIKIWVQFLTKINFWIKYSHENFKTFKITFSYYAFN